MPPSMPPPSPDPLPAAIPILATASRYALAAGSLSVLNTGAVVVAALYFGRELLEPIVLAVLLAFVLAPLVSVLHRARLGRVGLGQTLPVFIAVLLAFAVIGGIGMVVGRQVSTLAAGLPAYQSTIQQKVDSLHLGPALSSQVHASLQAVLGSADTAARKPLPMQPRVVTTAEPAGVFEAPSTLVIVRTVVQPLLGPLATLGIVLIFVIFVLLFREDLRDRLVRLVGRQDLHRTILAMNDAARRLSRYFLIQVAINTGFGAFIAAGLSVAGLPNPLLWGILAALMRFVPFIGTFIAATPPVLLALAVSPHWSLAVVVLLLYGLSELVMGQIVEPLAYGHSTGLSPIAVIMSATFWAFMWGPVGLLLATPLTVGLVVIGRHVESLAFLEVMLSDSPPLDAEETFYQRALEGNARVLTAQASAAVAQSSLLEYYDHVALRGLGLAQSDLSRDALAFERLDAVHAQVAALLETLGAQAAAKSAATPSIWCLDGTVLCIPGRGQLDDLGATMAMQVLKDAGFGATCQSNLILGTKRPEPAPDFVDPHAGVRLVCLSVLEQGSSPSAIRYLLRRISRQMPQAAIVVCLWNAAGTSPTLATLRSEGHDEMIVLSLSELVALTKAICARRGITAVLAA